MGPAPVATGSTGGPTAQSSRRLGPCTGHSKPPNDAELSSIIRVRHARTFRAQNVAIDVIKGQQTRCTARRTSSALQRETTAPTKVDQYGALSTWSHQQNRAAAIARLPGQAGGGPPPQKHPGPDRLRRGVRPCRGCRERLTVGVGLARVHAVHARRAGGRDRPVHRILRTLPYQSRRLGSRKGHPSRGQHRRRATGACDQGASGGTLKPLYEGLERLRQS